MRRAIALAIALSGCHRGGGGAAAKATTSCRAVAQATERFVTAAPEPQREAMLRFAVEVIDLCQSPGLSSATRKCVASAASADLARACPALPLVPLRAARPITSPEPDDEEAVQEYDLVDETDPDAP